MPRYIDADTAKAIYLSKSAGEQLDRVPTADVQEVKHGKWIKEWRDGFVNGKRNYELICPYCNFSYFDNQCGFIVPEHFNFCPNCGAKMDGDSTTNNIYNCETCKNLCCDGCEMYEGAKNGR